MPHLLHIVAGILQGLFTLGIVGCLITIPIVAIKFASVLFEPSEDDDDTSVPANEQEGAEKI